MTSPSGKPSQPAPFDAWAVFDFWVRRWRWLACWTVVFAVAGAGAARLKWGRSFTSTAQLVHYEPSAIDDTFHPRALATPSLVLMLQSPGLFEAVGARLQPPLSAKDLALRLQITLDRNNDIVTLTAVGSSAEQTTGLVKQFSDAAIAYTQTMQRVEATEAGENVARQLLQVESEIAAARAAVPAASVATVAALSATPEPVAAPPSDLPQRVQSARDQLDDLLVRYTDAHPLVREQRARLVALEDVQHRAPSSSSAPSGAGSRPAAPALSPAFYGRITPEEVALGERFRSLETNRALLIGRQRAIQPFRDAPPGYFRVLLSGAANPTLQHNHRLELVLCACLGAFFGLIGSAGQILLSEFLDNRIKTRADVRRVTGLPLLATLGDLQKMSPADRDQWAFRAWTALQSQLSVSSNHGIVCGITSAHSGDGRSTWIDLLARAAGNCGFRVLTITAQPSPEIAAELARRDRRSAPTATPFASPDSVALTTSVLSTPGQIVEQLSGASSLPRVDIPLPGWVWNLDRRKQWHSALEAWRTIEHVVIFVELPPASVAETVLLAENVPNILWLVDSNRSDATETHAELETLRHARCNLVGAVLNRERAAPLRGRFSRWFGASAALIVVGLGSAVLSPGLSAAEPAPVLTPEAAFSVTAPTARADWQKRLTLGPGDVLSFHLFGSPELTRDDVPIGPDGRVSYLEAENLTAAGLTVDELRERLNEELGKFRRAPQAFVTPQSYRSKRYYVLGTVVQKGIFTLDRPLTIIEAVARARGFETGLTQGNLVETTDFAQSFIGRGGRRLPVDFEKLFLHGDLSQNVTLEPGDYLYFPAAPTGSIHVLGAVRAPGAVPFDSDTSVLSAIATRGGFTPRAWKQHVLVVRQSSTRPEAFKVDAHGALAGNAPNLALQPGDLVYVSDRPWIRVEELLDRATSAFVEAAVISWTGVHIGLGGR
ncbi:MAG: polysaccharide biosynthesis/export family protein [Verrucomicrobia bacterium]|nr:polysaccharide biosynthesis/export family protein [Verrucomicrobiota bacterium]